MCNDRKQKAAGASTVARLLAGTGRGLHATEGLFHSHIGSRSQGESVIDGIIHHFRKSVVYDGNEGRKTVPINNPQS